MRLIDEASLEKITAAVQEAEKETAGEIVVVVAGSSSAWARPRGAFAFGVAAVLTVSAWAVAPSFVMPWLVAVFPVGFALAWLLSGVPAFLRALLTDDAVDEAVLRAAKVAFVDHGVHRTKDRAGVLVYVSLFEHRVQILGDAGIHKVVGEAGWKGYVHTLASSLKGGDVDGVVGVVKDIGRVLAREFPPSAENPNELPDAPRLN
jgi:putative membrane protein